MNRTHAPSDVPAEETFLDCTGRSITFTLDCFRSPTGWVITASEASDRDSAYEFQAFSPVSPYLALGDLRCKVRKGLATKYLTSGTPHHLTHDVACGHIAYDPDSEGVILVVDGRKLSMVEFERLLSSYEGWRFELRITDPGV